MGEPELHSIHWVVPGSHNNKCFSQVYSRSERFQPHCRSVSVRHEWQEEAGEGVEDPS